MSDDELADLDELITRAEGVIKKIRATFVAAAIVMAATVMAAIGSAGLLHSQIRRAVAATAQCSVGLVAVFLGATFVAAAILTAAIGAASPAHSSPGGCYIAASGDCVPYPHKGGPQPPDATAQCANGSWSFSEHPYASGTCHGHGGVQRYLW